MRSTLEQLFYSGVGSALWAKEKLDQGGDTGRTCKEQGGRMARELFDEVVAKGSEQREQVKGVVKDLLKEVIGELGLATRDDIAALRAELVRERPDGSGSGGAVS
jgi:polyhydroxyalkanoate synthesis regulator phasin